MFTAATAIPSTLPRLVTLSNAKARFLGRQRQQDQPPHRTMTLSGELTAQTDEGFDLL
jgi:hypothetical protein